MEDLPGHDDWKLSTPPETDWSFCEKTCCDNYELGVGCDEGRRPEDCEGDND